MNVIFLNFEIAAIQMLLAWTKWEHFPVSVKLDFLEMVKNALILMNVSKQIIAVILLRVLTLSAVTFVLA